MTSYTAFQSSGRTRACGWADEARGRAGGRRGREGGSRREVEQTKRARGPVDNAAGGRADGWADKACVRAGQRTPRACGLEGGQTKRARGPADAAPAQCSLCSKNAGRWSTHSLTWLAAGGRACPRADEARARGPADDAADGRVGGRADRGPGSSRSFRFFHSWAVTILTVRLPRRLLDLIAILEAPS